MPQTIFMKQIILCCIFPCTDFTGCQKKCVSTNCWHL